MQDRVFFPATGEAEMSGGGRFVWANKRELEGWREGGKKQREMGGFISHSCNNELSPMTAVILTRSEIS